jgi:hypothetical protein
MNLIAFNLSKGIKEAKWLAIDYKNANGEKTSFWISIKDILIETKEILVDEYNVTMTQNEYQGLLKDVKLKFERILSASYIEGTTYSQPDFLIELPKATPWLATAGSGDVLAGIIGALLATNYIEILNDENNLARVAATGAFIHNSAALLASKDAPIFATSIIEFIPEAIRKILK